MHKVLHRSRIDELLESKSPMNIVFVKRSTGEIVKADNVIVTSINGIKNTCNIEFENGEKRTARKCLILEIDNIKFYF